MFSVTKESPMKMPRDIKESLEMLLITRTGGEEARKVPTEALPSPYPRSPGPEAGS